MLDEIIINLPRTTSITRYYLNDRGIMIVNLTKSPVLQATEMTIKRMTEPLKDASAKSR